MVLVTCPDCGASLTVPEASIGGRVQCGRCRHVIVATAPPVGAIPVAEEMPPPPVPEPAPSLAFDRELDEPRPRHQSERPRRGLLFNLAIAGGVVLLGCTGLGTVIYFLNVRDIPDSVTAADRAVLVTVESLASVADIPAADPARGTFSKVRHLDGSKEVTYEYETPDDDEETLYVNCTVAVEPSTQDARYAYGGIQLGAKFGLSVTGNLEEVVRNDLWRWGDDSRCVLLKQDGQVVGNYFMARKGRRYFTLVIVGIPLDKPDAIRKLLDPMLRRLENYNG